MSVYVFKRYELKYLLDLRQYSAFCEKAKQYLTPDEYGQTAVQSLYYDSLDSLLIRRSLERPEYKEKLRLRSYGLVSGDEKAFLELKKKCYGVVFKRRISSSYEKLFNLELGSGQIDKEIKYFLLFYNDLQPKTLIIYDRTAYKGDGDLRVTFDKNVRYRTERLSLSAGLDGALILPEDKVLMEIKIGSAMPLWIAKILSELKIYKTTFSKYGEAYKKEFFAAKNNSPVQLPARNEVEILGGAESYRQLQSAELLNNIAEVKKVG